MTNCLARNTNMEKTAIICQEENRTQLIGLTKTGLYTKIILKGIKTINH